MNVKKQGHKGKKSKKLTSYNLLIVELKGLVGRRPDRGHLYISLTSRTTEVAFQKLAGGNGPDWIKGFVKKLRNDLVPNYRPTNKRDVAENRLEELKTDLARRGYGVNGDTTVWVVYVLDVDPDTEPVMIERGKKGKVVYVGQTSTSREKRAEQHRGTILSKSGKYIGSPKLKGRNPVLNTRLSPKKTFYTEADSIAFETATNNRLKVMGYRVLGDVLKVKSP